VPTPLSPTRSARVELVVKVGAVFVERSLDEGDIDAA
jgi:hypothetical protein